MKLLNILARELKVWPGDVGAITQDKLTGELLDYYHCPLRGGNEREVSSIADDAGEAHDGANGAAITRAEWRAAVDAIYAYEPAELKWPDGSTHFQEVIGGATRPVFWNVVDGVALKAWRMMPDKVTVEETYTYCSKGCPTFNISKCIERPAPKVVEWDGVGLPPVGSVVDTDHKNKELRVKILAYGAHHGGESCVLAADMSHGREGKMFGWISDQCNFRPVRTAEQVAAEERESGIQAIQDAYTYTVGHSTHKILHSQATRLYDAGCRLQVAP